MMNRREFLGAAAAAPISAPRPNILLVLMDDMGWNALSCYGNRIVPTPHLDRLAAEGVRFTDAYVTPQCTPTRATILTGQYTARNRMWHVIPWYGLPWARMREEPFQENLARGTFLLGHGLQRAGYKTACIGKWHLTANEDGHYTDLKRKAPRTMGSTTQPPNCNGRTNTIRVTRWWTG